MAIFKLSEGGWNKARRPFKSDYSGSAPSAFSDNTLAQITYDVSYTDQVVANAPADSPSTRYNITSGALPAGLELDTKTGSITGTPTASESYAFTVTASNPHGSVSESYTGTTADAPTWSDNTISSDMTATVSYSDTVTATGRPDPVYSVSSGSLPSGLSLNTSTGDISGTPTVALESYSFTITATNVAGSVSQNFLGTVAEPIPDSVYYLVLAGGAGGGNDGSYGGGGGGAGGYRSAWNGETSGGGAAAETAISITSGTNYRVKVGGGGGVAASGAPSIFGSVTSTGGGRGGAAHPGGSNGTPGGSGGGGGGVTHVGPGTSGGSGTAGQGYAGGGTAGNGGPGKNPSGGGGGAAGAGTGGSLYGGTIGRPGNGRASTISGSSVTRGRGGSGAGTNSGIPNANTGANTGGGGGSYTAGASGVVILRFNGPSPTIGPGLSYSSVTDSGTGDTILTFTSGDDNISWS